MTWSSLKPLGCEPRTAALERRLKCLRDIASRNPKWGPSVCAMRIQGRREEQVGAFACRQSGEVRRRNQPAPPIPLCGAAIVMLHQDEMPGVGDKGCHVNVGLDQLRRRGGCAPVDGD